jgi:hypothetical protein
MGNRNRRDNVKKFFCILFLMMSIATAAHAETLGTQTGGWDTDMGAYTYFHNVVFTSPSVGQQTEYYVEYQPNSEAVPVVVNGDSIWGRRNIEGAAQYMENNGMRPLIGINADYFSFQTGIPMGHTIIDGEIASKESEGQDAVGFRADGTGYIGWLDITTTLSDGIRSVDVMYINKWCQAGFDPIYLFTDKFGSSTKTESECIFVICTPESGKLKIGDKMLLKVDDVFTYDGEIAIPDGKIILAMDTSGVSEYYSFLSSLSVGQYVTITNEASDSEWNTIENGMGSVGGRLISNGVVNSDFEAGAAPRTAVGIKADGNIIFYVLDGRQQGYSYGAQLSTLAKRMSELGCVDAINLDGGGSTTIAGVFPGSDVLTVVNHPSDGELRSVANFIFLKDNREPTGIPGVINLAAKENNNYLSGATEQIEAQSVYDTHNYRMDLLSDVWYTAENYNNGQSYVDENGLVYMSGTGTVKITVSSDYATAETYYNSFENPDEIKIYNESDGKEISEIYTEANEELQLNLGAAAYVNGERLISSDNQFKWEIEGDIGTITNDGIFTLTDSVNKSGRINVTAGNCTKSIAVYISDYPKPVNPFADTDGHWAETVLSMMAYRGVINGIEEDGKMVFKPDNDMTRSEFAVMISNYLGLDTSEYEAEPLIFDDSYDIPLWAENSIKAMYENGIIQGRSNYDGTLTFNPYDKITRAEAMTILGRIINSNADAELDFADKDDIPEWAAESISKLLSAGIVSGYSDNTILPNNNVKRAEAVNMMYKAN